MMCITSLIVGLATLVRCMAPDMFKPSLHHGVNTTTATAATSEATIYNPPTNSSVEVPYIGLYSLGAAVENTTMRA